MLLSSVIQAPTRRRRFLRIDLMKLLLDYGLLHDDVLFVDGSFHTDLYIQPRCWCVSDVSTWASGVDKGMKGPDFEFVVALLEFLRWHAHD